MKDLKSQIEVKDGLVYTDELNRDLLLWQNKAKSGKYQVKIYSDKTQDQREYIHAVVFPFVARKMNQFDGSVGNDDAKLLMKKKFLAPIFHEFEYKGQTWRYKETRSTEDLSKKEYSQFIEDIIGFCINEFGEAPPEPNRG